MGTVSRIEMHSRAYNVAIQAGPKLVLINDRQVAAYMLTKQELAKLFFEGGWSPDRITWLKCIRSWREFYDDVLPQDVILLNRATEWCVLFRTCGSREYLELRDFANRNNVRAYNVVPELLVSPVRTGLEGLA